MPRSQQMTREQRPGAGVRPGAGPQPEPRPKSQSQRQPDACGPRSPEPSPEPLTLGSFNAGTEEQAVAALLRCCASTRWAARIAAHRPYPDANTLLAALDEASYDMTAADLLEALAEETPLPPSPDAGDVACTALRAAHSAYEERFGHCFLVCVDHVVPGERLNHALTDVQTRLANDTEEERTVVTEELRRLARGRLLRLLG